MLSDILFIILGFLTLSSASAMVYCRQPMNSALALIVTLLSIAGLFALLGGSFLFLVQIIIYAGAIVALILFIIMFLNIKEEELPQEPYKLQWLMGMALFISPLAAYLIYQVNHFDFKPLHLYELGSIKDIGMKLYTDWVLPFEMISLLLLISLIGVVILAKREKKYD